MAPRSARLSSDGTAWVQQVAQASSCATARVEPSWSRPRWRASMAWAGSAAGWWSRRSATCSRTRATAPLTARARRDRSARTGPLRGPGRSPPPTPSSTPGAQSGVGRAGAGRPVREWPRIGLGVPPGRRGPRRTGAGSRCPSAWAPTSRDTARDAAANDRRRGSCHRPVHTSRTAGMQKAPARAQPASLVPTAPAGAGTATGRTKVSRAAVAPTAA